MTDIPPGAAERMAGPVVFATGDEADIIAGAWAEYGRTGDVEALLSALAGVYEVDEDPRP